MPKTVNVHPLPSDSISAPATRLLQRACACGQHSHGAGECAECRKQHEGVLQRTAAGSAQGFAPPIVHEVLSTPGQPLDGQTRAAMEPRFGHDFSQVRVHTGPRAAESARAVNALAYTVGRNVVFAGGQYAPGTQAGQQLLAHELAHTVQQRHGDSSGAALTIGGSGDVAEDQARQAAARVTAGDQAGIQGGKQQQMLQREEGDDPLWLRQRELSLGPYARHMIQRETPLGQHMEFQQSRLKSSLQPPLNPEIGVQQLQLAPEIEAQIRFLEFMRGLITIDNLLAAVENLDLPLSTTPGAGTTMLSPQAKGALVMPPPVASRSPTLQPVSGFRMPLRPPQPPKSYGPQPLPPLVWSPRPRARANRFGSPSRLPPLDLWDSSASALRPGTIGDVIKAILGLPVVKEGVEQLRLKGERAVRKGWKSLSGEQRALVIVHAVALGAGSLVGIMSNPASRQSLFEQLQEKKIPIPGMPLDIEISLADQDNQWAVLYLDLGALMPRFLLGPK